MTCAYCSKSFTHQPHRYIPPHGEEVATCSAICVLDFFLRFMKRKAFEDTQPALFPSEKGCV